VHVENIDSEKTLQECPQNMCDQTSRVFESRHARPFLLRPDKISSVAVEVLVSFEMLIYGIWYPGWLLHGY